MIYDKFISTALIIERFSRGIIMVIIRYMASDEAVVSNCSLNIMQNFCVSEENLCTNCLSMKDNIQVLTSELKSAQLIIKMLQDELKSAVSEPTSTANLPSCVNNKPLVINKSESVSESEWVEI